MGSMKLKRLENCTASERNHKQIVVDVVCVKTGDQITIQLHFDKMYEVTKIKPWLVRKVIQRDNVLAGYQDVGLDALIMRDEELYFGEFRNWELS